MTDKLKSLANYILEKRSGFGLTSRIEFGELTIAAAPETIIGLLLFLRDDENCRFTTLIDICGADYPERAKRFDVVYHMLSMHRNQRIRVKLVTDENTPVPSALPVWPAANWFERETFDMYGIQFSDHPDLRRILTDYGFVGHPFRKDFPISGHVEMRYDEAEGRVIYQPVTIEPREITPRIVREEQYGG